MAVAQRSYAAPVARPTTRPVARPIRPVRKAAPKATPLRRPARPGVRVSVAPLLRPMLAATVFATVLISYLSGHAQMTHASYQRVKLQMEERNLRAEQNLLITRKNEQSGKNLVEQWAELHGFVKPTTPPLVLQCMSREGR